jgi:hypothetical protein
MTVTSANVPGVVLVEVGRSDVYRTYKVGPRTLPCGTPAFIGRISFPSHCAIVDNVRLTCNTSLYKTLKKSIHF